MVPIGKMSEHIDEEEEDEEDDEADDDNDSDTNDDDELDTDMIDDRDSPDDVSLECTVVLIRANKVINCKYAKVSRGTDH